MLEYCWSAPAALAVDAGGARAAARGTATPLTLLRVHPQPAASGHRMFAGAPTSQSSV